MMVYVKHIFCKMQFTRKARCFLIKRNISLSFNLVSTNIYEYRLTDLSGKHAANPKATTIVLMILLEFF